MSRSTRRRFIRTSSAAVFGFQFVPRHVIGQGQIPPSEKLVLGCIGTGGQGGSDIASLDKTSLVSVAALCDVDAKTLAASSKRYPNAKTHRDFRRLIEEQKDLDAVVIGTPDHIHAPAALMAMRAGRHVYVEKPCAHTIEEARRLREVAAETKRVTQMGNQGHAGEGLRLTKEWIDAGVIGAVKEVHVWSDRPGKFWDTQGKARPTDTPPVPNDLDWDLWLGPAPMRPYHPDYVPRKWRGWWDFGCGALGDMAVHNADPAFYALDLDAPEAVDAETSGHNHETFPLWSIIHYHFPARGKRGPVKLTWYDGGKMPDRPADLDPGRSLADNGILFVGEKGSLLAGGWAGNPRLLPETKMKDFAPPAQSLPRSPGHHLEWVQACKAGKPEAAKSGFAYSANFTESLLVGLLAVRLGKRIEWDSMAMKAKNALEAESFIRKKYRAGYSI